MRLLSLAHLLVCLMLISVASPARGDLTGADDRVEVTAAGREIRRLARSVALVTSRHKLLHLPADRRANTCTLLQSTLEDEKLYCPRQRFSGQGIGGSCTAFLIAPDILMTAAHCLADEPGRGPFDRRLTCESSAFVFDYWQDDSGQKSPAGLPESNIYYCAGLRRYQSKRSAAGRHQDAGESIFDYAFVRLDRRVAGRPPLVLASTGRSVSGRGVFALSHPHGLPLKASLSGRITSGEHNYYRSDLDISVGSSGGPVFDSQTGLVVALVKGVTYPAGYLDTTWDATRRCRCEYAFNPSQSPVILLDPSAGLELYCEDRKASQGLCGTFVSDGLNGSSGRFIPDHCFGVQGSSL